MFKASFTRTVNVTDHVSGTFDLFNRHFDSLESIEVFPKWKGNSVNLANSEKIAGTVVVSWSLTQELAGWNPFNYKYF